MRGGQGQRGGRGGGLEESLRDALAVELQSAAVETIFRFCCELHAGGEAQPLIALITRSRARGLGITCTTAKRRWRAFITCDLSTCSSTGTSTSSPKYESSSSRMLGTLIVTVVNGALAAVAAAAADFTSATGFAPFSAPNSSPCSSPTTSSSPSFPSSVLLRFEANVSSSFRLSRCCSNTCTRVQNDSRSARCCSTCVFGAQLFETKKKYCY